MSKSDLWVIEVRKAWGSEALWQLALNGDILDFMPQEFVVNVARHWGLIHRKRLQGALHPAAGHKQPSQPLLPKTAYQMHLN